MSALVGGNGRKKPRRRSQNDIPPNNLLKDANSADVDSATEANSDLVKGGGGGVGQRIKAWSLSPTPRKKQQQQLPASTTSGSGHLDPAAASDGYSTPNNDSAGGNGGPRRRSKQQQHGVSPKSKRSPRRSPKATTNQAVITSRNAKDATPLFSNAAGAASSMDEDDEFECLEDDDDMFSGDEEFSEMEDYQWEPDDDDDLDDEDDDMGMLSQDDPASAPETNAKQADASSKRDEQQQRDDEGYADDESEHVPSSGPITEAISPSEATAASSSVQPSHKRMPSFDFLGQFGAANKQVQQQYNRRRNRGGSGLADSLTTTPVSTAPAGTPLSASLTTGSAAAAVTPVAGSTPANTTTPRTPLIRYLRNWAGQAQHGRTPGGGAATDDAALLLSSTNVPSPPAAAENIAQTRSTEECPALVTADHVPSSSAGVTTAADYSSSSSSSDSEGNDGEDSTDDEMSLLSGQDEAWSWRRRIRPASTVEGVDLHAMTTPDVVPSRFLDVDPEHSKHASQKYHHIDSAMVQQFEVVTDGDTDGAGGDDVTSFVWEEAMLIQAVWQLLAERDQVGVEGSIHSRDNIWKKGPLKKLTISNSSRRRAGSRGRRTKRGNKVMSLHSAAKRRMQQQQSSQQQQAEQQPPPQEETDVVANTTRGRRAKKQWKVKYVELRQGNLVYYEDSSGGGCKTIHLRQSDTYVRKSGVHYTGRNNGTNGVSAVTSSSNNGSNPIDAADGGGLNTSNHQNTPVPPGSAHGSGTTTGHKSQQYYCFELKVQGTAPTYWMASSQEEQEAWITAIRSAMIGDGEDGTETRRRSIDLAPHQTSIERFNLIRESAVQSETREHYRQAVQRQLMTSEADEEDDALQIPLQWIRDQTRQLGKCCALPTKVVSKAERKGIRSLAPHKQLKASNADFWKKMGETDFAVNGSTIPKDSPWAAERVVGALTRCLLEYDKAGVSNESPAAGQMTEIQAVSYTRNILQAVFRSKEQQDAFVAVQYLLQNANLVAISTQEDDCVAVNMDISFAGEELPDDLPADVEEMAGWLRIRRSKLPIKGQKERYAVLSGAAINYYEAATPRPHGLRGQLILNGATLVEQNKEDMSSNEEDSHVLILTLPAQNNEERYLALSDAEKCEQWKSAIQEAIELCSGVANNDQVDFVTPEKRSRGTIRRSAERVLKGSAERVRKSADGSIRGGIRVISNATYGSRKLLRGAVGRVGRFRSNRFSKRGDFDSGSPVRWSQRRPSMNVLLKNTVLPGKREPTVQCVASVTYVFDVANRPEADKNTDETPEDEPWMSVSVKLYQAFLMMGGPNGRMARGDALIEFDFGLEDDGVMGSGVDGFSGAIQEVEEEEDEDDDEVPGTAVEV